MWQISKIHFTSKGEVSNYFNFVKKFELRTVRPTKKKPTNLSGFLFQELFFKRYVKSLFINLNSIKFLTCRDEKSLTKLTSTKTQILGRFVRNLNLF